VVRSQPWKIVCKTLSQKKTITKKELAEWLKPLEHLPSKCEVLSSDPSATERERERKREEDRKEGRKGGREGRKEEGKEEKRKEGLAQVPA
jgi:hypothetical protein